MSCCFPAYCSIITTSTTTTTTTTTTSTSTSLSPPLNTLPTNNHQTPQTVVSWTSSISHYCRKGMLSQAASEFSRMRLSGIQPNDITLLTLLSSFAHFPSNPSSLRFGVSIHGYISKLGFHTNNVMLYTALLHMYSKCARLLFARRVFDQMCVRNSRSWNTMIDGYMRSGDFENALLLFDEMPVRDKISWTALINGFVKFGRFEEALECFRQMQVSGVEPDYVTIIAVVSACANLGLLRLGIWFHLYAMRCGFCKNIRVRNSLIDLYSRCGCVEFARQEFQNMEERSLVSWNSMIVGLAINGHAVEALEHFCQMQREGFQPNGVSFTGALTACSHAGLVEKGLEFYDTMTNLHRISPRIEHYGCMVDLLSRAGQLEDAFSVIESMPMKPNEVVLGSLLAACRTHGNVSLANRLTRYLIDSKPDSDSSYVTLSNIYAASGSWDGVGNVRRIMKARGITKTAGFSSIELDCTIHEFLSGDKSHIHSECIYATLDHLSVELSLYGYVPNTTIEDLSECG